MKKVLVFRHAAHEGLGTIEPVLRENGVRLDYVDLFQKDSVPAAVRGYDALISMGGPMNADQTHDYPFLLKERALIRAAVDQGVLVVGICLGAQLIARALGTRVYAGVKKEIGWFPIKLTEEGRKDPLFKNLSVSDLIVFQWHGDTFDLPNGSALLASSPLFPHQAFRFRNSAYAFQFHIEVTREMIDDWIVKNKSELEPLRHEVSREQIVQDTARYEKSLKELAMTVYGPLFLRLVPEGVRS
jgi:GMP synthase (glutamine-hydrolysing)